MLTLLPFVLVTGWDVFNDWLFVPLTYWLTVTGGIFFYDIVDEPEAHIV